MVRLYKFVILALLVISTLLSIKKSNLQHSLQKYQDSCLILRDTINLYRVPKSIVTIKTTDTIQKSIVTIVPKNPTNKFWSSANKDTPCLVLDINTTKTYKSYTCGARTKKGGYCSRTVNGGGRCWQH